MLPRDRINGWKAIGAHFGRDRTTAMRWAQTRGLPVRRIPGGKASTVYALKSELDRWALDQDDEAQPVAEALVASTAPAPKRRSIWPWIAGGVAAVVLAGVIGLFVFNRGFVGGSEAPTVSVSAQLPADPELADLYLKARDDWARRTPGSLTRAVAGLERVTREDPQFAPAFAALADTYLLASEFGSMPDEQAFTQARAAARTSLRLDPGLAGAHRALGFIQYWWDNDPVPAGRSFRRALELAPNSAQTHFWYGNVLSDNGRHDAALRELNTARLLEPGAVAIQNDLAWAEWRAGRTQVAKEALEALIRVHPDFSAAWDCLAELRLSQGDYPGYVEAWGRYAALRDDPVLTARGAEQVAALKQGVPALQAVLLKRALERAGHEIGRNHAFAAFVASLNADRAALVRILSEADAAGETWGSSGEVSRIRNRWVADAEVSALLARRAPAAVE